MKNTAVACLVCAVLTGGLAACGQKGPLYLPQQQNKPQPEAKAAPATPATTAPVPATKNTEPS